MVYDSYRPVVYNEIRPVYDNMKHNDISMKYLSGDPQVLIL
jgi:hypothetical protein